MLFGDPGRFLIDSLFLVPGLLVGLILHEVAHARVAVARGDQTPRLDGRLSLDPRNHLDPLGTIAIFLIRFGWAKPVRINPSRMKHRFDPALVAVAGPLTNLLIAVALSIPLKLALATGGVDAQCAFTFCVAPITLLASPITLVFTVLLVAFYLNVVLAFFNILPIPPLDGYNLVETLFRRKFPRFFFQVDMNRQVIMLVLVLILFIFPTVLGRVIAPVYATLAGWLLGAAVYPGF